MVACNDDHWAQSWFIEMLIAGLVQDGLDSSGVNAVQAVFATTSPRSPHQLLDYLKESSGDIGNSVAMVASLISKADFNRNCYLKTTREDTRVIAWPNNQRTKVSNPDLYFDIYKDLPYKEAPRFITQQTPIGSAGSCFALRIAHQLQAWGYNYVIKEDDLPSDLPLERLSSTSYRMSSARYGTLFNVPSMRQMVERAYGLWHPEPILVKKGKRLIDPFRSIKPLYDDIPGYIVDLERHNLALRQALDSCEVFVITLGLTEAWKFAHNGNFTSIAPEHIDPTLVRPHDLTVEENVNELERLFEVYSHYRPGIKLIVSVSPVPLNKTFSKKSHVVVANSLSKSTLRVAAEIFCRNHPGDVYYFPSYEIVTYGTRNPWESDMRHVSAEAVARVMNLFRVMFFTDQTSNLESLWHEEFVDSNFFDYTRGFIRMFARRFRFRS